MTRTTTARRPRVRAPELTGRGWIGTGGRELSLAALRGKVVLLDFWTSCCVNCLHVLDELRALERDYADVLVVVGVHSPKFSHEAEPGVVAAAVQRHGVHHPVLDDPELTTWRAYAARAWPTLVVVDPTGSVVAQLAGEGHAHGLRVLLDELVSAHEAAGTLHRGDGPYTPPPQEPGALRFPGAAVALPDGGWLVADTAHHQLVRTGPDATTATRGAHPVAATGDPAGDAAGDAAGDPAGDAAIDAAGDAVHRIGDGMRGLLDGPPHAARFAEPQGLAVLPADVAARVGYDVVVADTANHALRGLRLADGRVVTVAGTGRQLRRREGGGPALGQDLSTPWDVAWFDGQVVVAMAGVHQLWAFDPAPEPGDGVVRVLAGTSAEGLRDGPAEQAWFAQTSGLAASADGATLWLVDAETSALRALRRTAGPVERAVPRVADARFANAAPVAGPGYAVSTLVGTGLFDFGHRDGPAGQALLQHPLGVAELPDGAVAVADTYNGAVRRVDPVAGEVSTLASGLVEPADVAVDGDTLLVVESGRHALVRIPLPERARRVNGAAGRTRRPATPVAPGRLRLRVAFTPPSGQALDDRDGDPTRLLVSASPPGLLLAGEGRGAGLQRELELSGAVAEGVLHVSAQAAACDGDPATGGAAEHAACHLYQQDWGIPLRVEPGAADALVLDLRGV